MNNKLTPTEMSLIRSSLKSKTVIVLHTPTEEIAIALVEFLADLNYGWSHIGPYKSPIKTSYEDYQENTCYCLDTNTLSYSGKKFFIEDPDYKKYPLYILGDNNNE